MLLLAISLLLFVRLAAQYGTAMYQRLETGISPFQLAFWYGSYPPPYQPYGWPPKHKTSYRRQRYPYNDPFRYLILGALTCFAILYLLGIIQT